MLHLIFGKLGCAQHPAELIPILADLASPPTLATGSRPEIDPFVAVALQQATAGIADDDDPAVLAVDHPNLIGSNEGRSDGPGSCLGVTGVADDPQP